MYSFYGGKQGRTYHIVKTFASIHDMVTHFQNGGQYVDVMYHEYVLIDTTRPEGDNPPLGINDPENGCLYRRGFDYDQPIADRVDPTYGQGTSIENQEAVDNYLHNPGAGAIYVGCIRGSEGPGLLLRDVNVFTKSANSTLPTSDSHWEEDVENRNQITISPSSVSIDAGGKLKYDLNTTVPVPTFDTPTVRTLSANTPASVTIAPHSDNAPFLLHSTFDLPRGFKGDSVTSAALSGNPGARNINFTITTRADDGSTGSTVESIPYYGLEKLNINASNMHLMATYTNSSPVTGNSTVSDLGKLQYGILTQPTVYRMTKSDSNTSSSINPSLPTFTQGDYPITLQTLKTTEDSLQSTDVNGTYLLGYDASTTHTSKFDEQHVLQNSHWYKMQDLSSIDAVPGKIITAGIMSDTGEIGQETVTYVNDVKANIDLLSSNGFIFNAVDTEIHEFGTDIDTHPIASSYSADKNNFYKGTREYIYSYVQPQP